MTEITICVCLFCFFCLCVCVSLFLFLNHGSCITKAPIKRVVKRRHRSLQIPGFLFLPLKTHRDGWAKMDEGGGRCWQGEEQVGPQIAVWKRIGEDDTKRGRVPREAEEQGTRSRPGMIQTGDKTRVKKNHEIIKLVNESSGYILLMEKYHQNSTTNGRNCLSFHCA